jgi:hypothetical protein
MKALIIALALLTIGCQKEYDWQIEEADYPVCRIEFSNVRVHQNNRVDLYQFRFRLGVICKQNNLCTGFPVDGKGYDYGIPNPAWGVVYRNVKPPYKGYSGVCSYTFDLVNDDIAIQIKPINSPSWLYMFTLKVYIDDKLEKIIDSKDYETPFYTIIKIRNNY